MHRVVVLRVSLAETTYSRMSIGWIETVVKDGKVVLPGKKDAGVNGAQTDSKIPTSRDTAVTA